LAIRSSARHMSKARPLRVARVGIRMLCSSVLFAAALVLGPSAFGDGIGEDAHASLDEPRVANAWRVLRIVNCERCHGKDYEGLAAPSVVEYARTQTRERFVRTLLDGDPPRGMPGYRDNPLVSESIDGIYRYFVGRANGAIDATSRP
jgi:cytochrome c55X